MARQPASAQDNEMEMDTVKDDIASLRKDVDKLVADLSKLAEQETDKGVKRTKKVASAAQDELESAGTDIRDYIRDNPLSSCGAAVGIGFIAALVMRK